MDTIERANRRVSNYFRSLSYGFHDTDYFTIYKKKTANQIAVLLKRKGNNTMKPKFYFLKLEKNGNRLQSSWNNSTWKNSTWHHANRGHLTAHASKQSSEKKSTKRSAKH